MNNTRVRSAIDVRKIDELWKRALGEGDASALSELVALAKDSRVKNRLNAKQDRAELAKTLSCDSPKARKNAARLIGNLDMPEDEGALLVALYCETTRFVVPSILLALGAVGGDSAKRGIEKYMDRLPAPKDESDAAHDAEIKKAAQLALGKLSPRQVREYTGLFDIKLELRAPENCGDLLQEEARAKGFNCSPERDSLVVRAARYEDVFALRCFEEALIPLGGFKYDAVDFNDRAACKLWAQSAAREAAGFGAMAAGCLSPAPIPYRIEIKGADSQEQRGSLARALAENMNSEQLNNSPSAYDAELRVELGHGRAKIYAKLFAPVDPRFAYRLGSLPASINPVVAACIMRFFVKYMKPVARVIDPCCGSGTLLIERARYAHGELVGVDTDNAALTIARKNSQAADTEISYVGGDMRKFSPAAPFDELFANLPFGTRVGTAEQSSDLYRAFVARLDKLLSPGGTALLYTTQRAPLARLLEGSSWKIVDERRFSAGGLSPWGIVLKR